MNAEPDKMNDVVSNLIKLIIGIIMVILLFNRASNQTPYAGQPDSEAAAAHEAVIDMLERQYDGPSEAERDRSKRLYKTRIAQLEKLWLTDLTFKMQGHTLTLPYAARLRLELSKGQNIYLLAKDYDPETIYKDVYRFGINGPQQGPCGGEDLETCERRNEFNNERWSRWCELRPDMAESFWCVDELNVLRMTFANIEPFQFEARKNWLENLSSTARPIPYKGRGRRLIIHKTLGRDKRGETIFSVCSSHTCTLDYAVEANILARINYYPKDDDLPDEALEGYIDAADARWNGFKAQFDD